MNSNFTLRNIVCLFFFSFTFSASFAQVSKATNVDNLQASVKNNQLLINWNGTETANYSEIQASVDGKTFTTIGLVLGADPKQQNSYSYKHDIKKMKAGQAYYRVLTVVGNEVASVSKVIVATKSL